MNQRTPTGKIFADSIAKLALIIKAIFLRALEPFDWASTWKSPIYNNNRRHLSYLKNRETIVDALINIIREQNLFFDATLGTSTAGIPWAALLAFKLKKSLIIIQEDENGKKCAYEFDPFQYITKNFRTSKEITAIISPAPWSIPFGVIAAEITNKPFLYVRKTAKDHGLGQQIEGVPMPGKVTIAAVEGTDTSFMNEVLEKEGMIVSQDDVLFGAGFRKVDISKLEILVVEDLMSTGGSSIKEVNIAREFGAIVRAMLTVFNYDFPVAKKLADDANITVYSALTYAEMLPVAIKEGYIENTDLTVLTEWNPDPEGWSERWKAQHSEPTKAEG